MNEGSTSEVRTYCGDPRADGGQLVKGQTASTVCKAYSSLGKCFRWARILLACSCYMSNKCSLVGGDNKHNMKNVRGRIQKFPDWLPEARTANGTALCH
jgi:hypothetical protein